MGHAKVSKNDDENYMVTRKNTCKVSGSKRRGAKACLDYSDSHVCYSWSVLESEGEHRETERAHLGGRWEPW